MITSKQQKNLIADKIHQLAQRLDSPPKQGVPPHILAMETAQLNEELDELQGEIDEYDAACQATLDNYTFATYQAFLKFPIVIRLAKGLSQQEFAAAVGISLSQLKRYEVDAYQNAPTHVVNQVLEHFKLHYTAQISKAS